MSLEILDRVKSFLIKLVKDESFRTQLMSEKVEDVKKIMTDGGYNFSKDEFEKATIKILELKELGQFDELSEEELVGAVGGLTVVDTGIVQPMYGIIWWPPKGHPRPKPFPKPKPFPAPQPMYGIVVDPIDIKPIDEPIVQPMYGVISPDKLY